MCPPQTTPRQCNQRNVWGLGMTHSFGLIGDDATILSFWSLLRSFFNYKTVTFPPWRFKLSILKFVKISGRYSNFINQEILSKDRWGEIVSLWGKVLSYPFFPQIETKLCLVIANELDSVANVGGICCLYLCKAGQTIMNSLLCFFINLIIMTDS